MGDEPGKDSDTPIPRSLEYGQPIAWIDRRETRRALTVLLVSIVILIAVLLLLPLIRRMFFLYRQGAIWTYSAPASQMMYSDYPADSPKLLVSAEYHSMTWTWDLGQFGNAQPMIALNAVAHVPPLLREMLTNVSIDGCAYLRAGKTVRGLPRIAAVLMTLDVPKPNKRRLRLLGVAIRPAEIHPKSQPVAIGQSGVDFFLDTTDRLRIFSGTPDPADPARFDITYELNGETGTIEGLIDNEYWVTLKVRNGPAVSKSGQWSIYHNETGR